MSNGVVPTPPDDVIESAQRILGDHRWSATWEGSAHSTHNFDSGCAVCAANLYEIVRVVAPAVFAAGRAQAAAAIRARLAEDIAEGDDVSTGHAISEQHGWREGLKLAADIAEEGLTP